MGFEKSDLEEHEVRRYSAGRVAYLDGHHWCFHSQGERFGELAFINRTDRAASVTACS